MFKFKKIYLNTIFKNPYGARVFGDVYECAEKFQNQLFDDFFKSSPQTFLEKFINLINFHTPYFWAIYEAKSNKFAGFCYFYDVIKNRDKIFSATVTTAFDKAFWGKKARICAHEFLNYVFEKFEIQKLKAETYAKNPYPTRFLRDLGFVCEGILKGETLSNGAAIDVAVWRKTPEIYNKRS